MKSFSIVALIGLSALLYQTTMIAWVYNQLISPSSSLTASSSSSPAATTVNDRLAEFVTSTSSNDMKPNKYFHGFDNGERSIISHNDHLIAKEKSTSADAASSDLLLPHSNNNDDVDVGLVENGIATVDIVPNPKSDVMLPSPTEISNDADADADNGASSKVTDNAEQEDASVKINENSKTGQQQQLLEDQSILVLMSLSIKDPEGIQDEMHRIKEDYDAICSTNNFIIFI